MGKTYLLNLPYKLFSLKVFFLNIKANEIRFVNKDFFMQRILFATPAIIAFKFFNFTPCYKGRKVLLQKYEITY